MDKSRVELIVLTHLDDMARELGIGDHSLIVDCGRCFEERKASCHRQVPYKRADIRIDHDASSDDADVIRDLRHELIHVVLGEMDVAWNAARNAMGPDSTSFAMFDSTWTFGIERAVGGIERILDRLGHTPDSILARKPLNSQIPQDEPPRESV